MGDCGEGGDSGAGGDSGGGEERVPAVVECSIL